MVWGFFGLVLLEFFVVFCWWCFGVFFMAFFVVFFWFVFGVFFFASLRASVDASWMESNNYFW